MKRWRIKLKLTDNAPSSYCSPFYSILEDLFCNADWFKNKGKALISLSSHFDTSKFPLKIFEKFKHEIFFWKVFSFFCLSNVCQIFLFFWMSNWKWSIDFFLKYCWSNNPTIWLAKSILGYNFRVTILRNMGFTWNNSLL